MKKIKLLILILSIAVIGFFVHQKLTAPDIEQLSDIQITNYQVYEPSISNNTNLKDIKELCKEQETGTIGDVKYIKLVSTGLKPYLYYCKEINWIEQINEILYINYITKDNITVTLAYNKNGLFSKDIYDEKNDTLVSIKENSALLYRNFRKQLCFT